MKIIIKHDNGTEISLSPEHLRLANANDKQVALAYDGGMNLVPLVIFDGQISPPPKPELASCTDNG